MREQQQIRRDFDEIPQIEENSCESKRKRPYLRS
jgi:hypothetical protein